MDTAYLCVLRPTCPVANVVQYWNRSVDKVHMARVEVYSPHYGIMAMDVPVESLKIVKE